MTELDARFVFISYIWVNSTSFRFCLVCCLCLGSLYLCCTVLIQLQHPDSLRDEVSCRQAAAQKDKACASHLFVPMNTFHIIFSIQGAHGR